MWEDVSMNFIMGLLPSKGLTVILMMVDCFSKYAHFEALPTNFNAHRVAEVFMDIVVKHHGIPKTIVSDHDPIFVTLYGKLPPLVITYPRGSSKAVVVDEALGERVELLFQLKKNLLDAKKPYGNEAKRLSNKLPKRYYGPYEILERVGKVAYRLTLLETSKIHPVFHVSILKAFSGNGIEEVSNLPEELYEAHPD
ncbi:ty3-gypsy retrotransposon protein [Tanacetum coccineum]